MRIKDIITDMIGVVCLTGICYGVLVIGYAIGG